MSFVFAFALAAVVLVARPVLRAPSSQAKRADTLAFAPAHLVPPAPPRARRRSELEDRALFATRALAVVGLALLGASPFVRCSRLSALPRELRRVRSRLAVVLDDSMSMQAKLGAKTRWERAKEGATELLASTRDGDAVAIVLAGAPARVALAATTDLASGARDARWSIAESDRATDLDGALAMARSLIDGLPAGRSSRGRAQRPRRRRGERASTRGRKPGPRVERAPRASRGRRRLRRRSVPIARGLRVRVRVACSPGFDATKSLPRTVAVSLGEKILAAAPAPVGVAGDVVLTLPKESRSLAEEPGALVARLRGTDAIDSDDAAPVAAEAVPGSVAVVVPSESEVAATGGAPVVEQALTALALDIAVRPLPQIPDRLGGPRSVRRDHPRRPARFHPRGAARARQLRRTRRRAPCSRSARARPRHLGRIARAVPCPAWSRGTRPLRAWRRPHAPPTGSSPNPATSLSDLGAAFPARPSPRGRCRATSRCSRWKDHAPLIASATSSGARRGMARDVAVRARRERASPPVRRSSRCSRRGSTPRGRRTVPRRTEVGAAVDVPGCAQRSRSSARRRQNLAVVVTERAVLRTTPPRLGLYRHRRGRQGGEPGSPSPHRESSTSARGRSRSPRPVARSGRTARPSMPHLALAVALLLALLVLGARAASPGGAARRTPSQAA